MGPAFHFLAERFSLLKLRVYVQFQQGTELPSFKGSMLHGWFGHAIKAVDEHAFFVLYGSHGNQQPKPYLVCPSDDLKTHWHKNELYHFDIVLFGEATQLAESVLKALQYGQKLGLGPKRTPFSLTCVCSVLPTQLKAGIHPTCLSEWLTENAPAGPQTEIATHYQTPIRMKSAGKIVKNKAPNLDEWLNHIIRRWRQLSTFWVVDSEELFSQLYAERPCLGDYEISSHLYFEDWQRYSHKERDNLPFGGLQGQVSYFGDIATAIPWLAVGQQLHVGGKTTFGLGKYQLIT